LFEKGAAAGDQFGRHFSQGAGWRLTGLAGGRVGTLPQLGETLGLANEVEIGAPSAVVVTQAKRTRLNRG
jgi:hypothetical protein